MADNLMRRITDDPPVTVLEAAIISAISYFLDNQFLISINNQFPVNQQPVLAPLPANWRNNIVIVNNFSNARFFIRRNNQTFCLTFTHDTYAQKVMASPIVSS